MKKKSINVHDGQHPGVGNLSVGSFVSVELVIDPEHWENCGRRTGS